MSDNHWMDTLRETADTLGKMYQAGQLYHCLDYGYRVLAAAPHAPEIAQLLWQVAVDLELGGPARELLELRRDLSADSAERARLREVVAALPDGRVPWSDRQTIYQNNRAVLVQRWPALADLAANTQSALVRLQLHRSRRGHLLLSQRSPGKPRRWLGEMTTVEENPLPPFSPNDIGPFVVIGLRTGILMENIFRAATNIFLNYSPFLLLVEPDPLRLAAWLHAGDFTQWLCQERVHLFAGEQAFDDLTVFLEQHPEITLPTKAISFQGEKTDDRASKAIHQVGQRRRAKFAERMQQMQDRYAERDAAWWLKRFKPPGRVVALASRQTTVLKYAARDALAALAKLGYETTLLTESNDHQVLSPEMVSQRIMELDPILLILPDHLRYEYKYLPANLPVLTWIQDPLPELLCQQAGESIGPLDLVCGYYRRRCTQEFGYPPEQFIWMSMPASTQVFHDGIADEQLIQTSPCDICFVSNGSQTIEQMHQEMLAKHDRAAWPMLTALYERVCQLLAKDGYVELQSSAVELTRSTLREFGLNCDERSVNILVVNHVNRMFDWGRRQQTLRWVADWARRTKRTFRLYGRGWDQHPDLAEFAAGPIENGEPLRCAYQNARLGLQLVPAGFGHQRTYEMLATGLLPLTRYCPPDFNWLSIEEFVAHRQEDEHREAVANIFPSLERIVFRNAAEFEAMAERYLDDGEYHRQVLGEFREVVLRKFTYDVAMRRLMGAFKRQLARVTEAKRQNESVEICTG